MTFPAETLKEIRRAVGPDYTVIIKISGGDMLGGYDLQYMIDFMNQLPEGTIDGVTVTGGWQDVYKRQINKFIDEDGSYGKFVVEPLERGYGTTLGTVSYTHLNS